MVSPSPCSACSRMVLLASGVFAEPRRAGETAAAHPCRCASSAIRISRSRGGNRRAVSSDSASLKLASALSGAELPAPCRSSSSASWWRLSASNARPRLIQALTMAGHRRQAPGRRPSMASASRSERAQRIALVVERVRVAGLQRQRRIVVGQRLFGRAKLRERIAAVDAGLDVTRLARKHTIERGQRLVRALELEQQVAAVVERVEMIRARAPAPCRCWPAPRRRA